MIYIVTEVKNKDWDEKDSVKLRFVGTEPLALVEFFKKQDDNTLTNLFVVELDNIFAPLNTPISVDLLTGSDINAKEFLKVFDQPVKSKKKIK